MWAEDPQKPGHYNADRSDIRQFADNLNRAQNRRRKATQKAYNNVMRTMSRTGEIDRKWRKTSNPEDQQTEPVNLIIAFHHSFYRKTLENTKWVAEAVANVEEAVAKAADYDKKYGIKNLIIMGHGSYRSLSLGNYSLDPRDFRSDGVSRQVTALASIVNMVRSDGAVLFYGCSSGQCLGADYLKGIFRSDIPIFMNTSRSTSKYAMVGGQKQWFVNFDVGISQWQDAPIINLQDCSEFLDIEVSPKGHFNLIPYK